MKKEMNSACNEKKKKESPCHNCDRKCHQCGYLERITQELEDDFYLTQVLGVPLV